MRILIVEDEALIAMALEDQLRDAGHEVYGPAATYEKALDIAEKAPPDLAFVDMLLSDGATGARVAAQLFSTWGTLSVLTSGGPADQYGWPPGTLGYIDKPCPPEALDASIRAAEQILRGETPTAPPKELHLRP